VRENPNDKTIVNALCIQTSLSNKCIKNKDLILAF
jgi:hypothetical protein